MVSNQFQLVSNQFQLVFSETKFPCNLVVVAHEHGSDDATFGIRVIEDTDKPIRDVLED